MAGKKKFYIKAPHGQKIETKYKGTKVSVELKWTPGFESDKAGMFSRKQSFVDRECIRRMAGDTPRRTGILVKSATIGTVIGSGEINQVTPYARRQYYEHRTKSKWFETMKNREKDSILKGAQKIE